MGQDVTLKQLTDKESNLVAHYIEHGDAQAAARAAGYSESVILSANSVLLSKPHIAWSLAVATRKRLASSAPMALRVIETLARDENQQARVRLEAAKTLLDRAGHVAPRIADKTAETPLHEMSTDELKTLASRLEGELADRSKPVISAIAAPGEQPSIDLVG